MPSGRHSNVEPFVPKADGSGVPLDERAKHLANELRPKGLSRPQRKIWDRVAPVLALHRRLTPLYLDVVYEYVITLDRMQSLRKTIAENGEFYESKGRQGVQLKSHPATGQLNLTERRWNSLVSHLQLSPATARDVNAALGDLFGDDPDGFFA